MAETKSKWPYRGVVAIDLAKIKTGVAFFFNSKLLPEEIRLITLEPSKTGDQTRTIPIFAPTDMDGFKRVRDAILGHIMDLNKRYGVDTVVIEDFAFSARGRAIFDIGMINGIVRLGIMESGLRYEFISPSAVKKAVTGKGNADKIMVAVKVSKLYGIDLTEIGRGCEDLYDAIAIGHAYIKGYQEGVPITGGAKKKKRVKK
jgi:Holliday junction resolvasome RuvABC endonuclease subunit